MVGQISNLLSTSTLIGGFILILLLVGFLLPKVKELKTVLKYVTKHDLLFAWIVALFATAGSLFYSEIAGYEPCKLCWLQRIFMYPQAIMLGIAWKLKDRAIIKYSLVLSIIGGVIALYHYLLQLGIAPSLECGIVGYSVSCSQRFVLAYNYITIPVMSLTAFLLIIFLFATSRFLRK